EVVVAASVDQARAEQLVLGEAALSRLLGQRAPAGREPEPVLAAHGVRQPATLEIRARRLSPGGVPQIPLVERGGLVEDLEQTLAPLPRTVRLRGALLVLERHAEPLRQPLDRAGEVEVLALLDERNDVAADPAAEAVVQ